MKTQNKKSLIKLCENINTQIEGLEKVATIENGRAYGGIIRAAKGKILESLCQDLVKIAWQDLGGHEIDLTFPSKRVPIPLKKNYLSKIKSPDIKDWIKTNIKKFVFYAQVDVHVFIKDKFVLGIECKSYTENAMLKRILVDFTLLKTAYPDISCVLLQFESQLTGDYSQINNNIIYGSHSTHTLLSYFDIDLNIITLLEGERKVNEEFQKEEFRKIFTPDTFIRTVEKLQDFLMPFIKQ